MRLGALGVNWQASSLPAVGTAGEPNNFFSTNSTGPVIVIEGPSFPLGINENGAINSRILSLPVSLVK
jgi:hypothetical protein